VSPQRVQGRGRGWCRIGYVGGEALGAVHEPQAPVDVACVVPVWVDVMLKQEKVLLSVQCAHIDEVVEYPELKSIKVSVL
jgi:hypothetical protein